MASLCHPWFTTANLSYRFPIFETSATALRGTTGICLFVNGCERIQKRGKGTHHVVTIISLQLSSLGPSTEYNMLTRWYLKITSVEVPSQKMEIVYLCIFYHDFWTRISLLWIFLGLYRSPKNITRLPQRSLCHSAQVKDQSATAAKADPGRSLIFFWTWNWAL